jgi:hypothetical protein
VQNSANNKDGENWNATFTDLVTPLSGVTRSLYFPVYLPNNPIMEFGDFNIVNVSPSLVYVNYAQNLILSWPMTFDNYFDGYTNLALYRATVSENVITNININWRCKGTLTFTPTFDGQIDAFIIAERASISQLITPLGGAQIANNVFLTAYTACVIPFDISFSGTVVNPNIVWDQLSYYFAFNILKTTTQGLSDDFVFSVDYDGGGVNYFNMEANSTNAISTTDSVSLPDLLEWLPTAYYSSECPQLQIESELRDCLARYSITKGSFLRNVIEPSVPQLFTSFEFMFDNCRKIFNIGWGFDNNETELLIGNINDFYLGSVVADVGLVNKATFTTAKDLIYGTITIGYNKWEAEEYNGLDEMNTERQYRRNINSNPSELDLMADIISAGYTIEVTRRKNQAETGTSDWRYDDDLFIINTFEDEGQLYAYRGVDLSPAFVYSPATRMNFTLTPVRNLMRWFRTLAAPTPDVTNESLKFTSGTGNFRAGGQMTTSCPVEIQQIFENSIINSTLFQSSYKPIWETIYATFEAPLSMVQFEAIKTNVYGAIRFRCGNDLYLGNIVTLSHEPNTGLASFKLLLRR